MEGEAKTAASSGDTQVTHARNVKPIIVGGVCSFALLVVALIIEGQSPAVLKVPAVWVTVAALPAVIGLLVSGYVKSFSGPGGFGFEAAAQPPIPDLPLLGYQQPTAERAAPPAPTGKWTEQRAAEYKRTRNIVLVHAYKRRESADEQKYDVSIYLGRHVSKEARLVVTGLDEIEKAEFFFGDSWRDRVFDARVKDGIMGCKVAAFGPFLALCRVTFASDHQSVTLTRYIDFEMADVLPVPTAMQ